MRPGVHADPETRAAAVAYSQEHGTRAAAEKFGVHVQTINQWRRARGLTNKRRKDKLDGLEE